MGGDWSLGISCRCLILIQMCLILIVTHVRKVTSISSNLIGPDRLVGCAFVFFLVQIIFKYS